MTKNNHSQTKSNSSSASSSRICRMSRSFSGDMNRPLKDHHHFPFKLYNMLEYAANSQYSSAVSWTGNGQAFVIHNKVTFLEYFVPMFFKQTKFRSFTRQLNIYGFTRFSNEGPKEAWQHKHFIRGRIERLKSILRVEVKNGGPKVKTSQLKNEKLKQRRNTHTLGGRRIAASEESYTSISLSTAISSISMEPAYASPKSILEDVRDQNHIMPRKIHQTRANCAACDAPLQQASPDVSTSCCFSVERPSSSFNSSTRLDRFQHSIPCSQIQHLDVQPIVGDVNEEDFLLLLSGIFASDETSYSDDFSSILSRDDVYEDFVNPISF